jgi:GTPase Era involved in 16S rRNA processing
VSEKWDTLGVVVVVMDAKQGVNTEDSVFLLNLVKNDNETKKQIPVIILCNKVDDPEDEEQAEMVAEARKEVEKIFAGSEESPSFIPISAMHANIHQCVYHMTRESFEDFDQDMLEKFG